MLDFSRKRNRLHDYDYSTNNMYYVTICTRDKKCILCDSQEFSLTEIGKTVLDAINHIQNTYEGAIIDKFVIMPNHIHIMILLTHCKSTLSNIISQMKRHASIQSGEKIWQNSFFDHIVRNEADYLRIWEYIEENPQKWEMDQYYPESRQNNDNLPAV